MSLRYLFLDLNSYFASVEQHLRPELRDRPVAVVPMQTMSTCCLAASYQAKAKGIKTGMRIGEALQRCPDLVLAQSRPVEYVKMHHRIIDAVEQVLPVHGVYSIDEMACRLLGDEREPERARALALDIKRSIRERIGPTMRCSIGVAPNRVLAKVATDMHKPDGLVIIERQELPDRLYSLNLQDLPGIGPNMEKRLNAAGIFTVRDLCARTRPELIAAWNSVLGGQWHHWLRGEDVGERPTHRRTVGHQHVLPPDQRTDQGARAIAMRLLAKAAARMRSIGYAARRLDLRVSHVREATWSAWCALGHGSTDTLAMVEALGGLWVQRPRNRTPLLVSVTLSDLVPPESAMQPLFGDERDRDSLNRAIDRLNAKYGRHTVYTGGIHDHRTSARGGIAFHVVPDLDLPDAVG